MPRRHQVSNPAAQPKRPLRASSDSTAQSSAPSPTTQPRAQSSTSSSNSSAKARSSQSTQSSTTRQATSSQSSQSRSTSSGKSNVFDLSVPVALMAGVKTATTAEQEQFFNLKSVQLTSSLISQPLMLHNDVRVVKLLVHAETVEIFVSRPVSQEEVQDAFSGHFRSQFAQRMSEHFSSDQSKNNQVSLQQSSNQSTAKSGDMISVLMKSEHTKPCPPQSMKWFFIFGECDMVAKVHSLLCLIDHQVQWEAFLREMNQHIASVLPRNSITDSSGQKASHVILSNHERKLQITLKFHRPCSIPNQQWVLDVETSITMLLTVARQQQLESDPTNENNKRVQNEIMQVMIQAARNGK